MVLGGGLRTRGGVLLPMGPPSTSRAMPTSRSHSVLPAPPPHPPTCTGARGKAFAGAAQPSRRVFAPYTPGGGEKGAGAGTTLPASHLPRCGAGGQAAPSIAPPVPPVPRRALAGAGTSRTAAAWAQGVGHPPRQADHPCARCGWPSRRKPHRAPRAGHHLPRPQKPQAGTGGQHHSAPSQAGGPPALPSPSLPAPNLCQPRGRMEAAAVWASPDPSPAPPCPSRRSPPVLPQPRRPCVLPRAGGAEAEGSSLRQRALPHRMRRGGLVPVAQQAPAPTWLPGIPPLAYAERSAAPRAKPHCAVVIFPLLGLPFSSNNSNRSPSFSRPRGERRATTTRRGPVRCLMAAGPPRWEGT